MRANPDSFKPWEVYKGDVLLRRFATEEGAREWAEGYAGPVKPTVAYNPKKP